MKVGISTASFFTKLPTESVFDALRQMRCKVTEVFLNTYYEYEKAFVEALYERVGAIEINSVHALGTQFEPELFNESQRVRTDAELFFRKVCIAGKVLGAKYYTFHGPMMFKNKKYNIDFVKFATRLNEIIEIALSYGIELSYENIHYSYFSEPAFFETLSGLCPKLRATLDTKHAVLSGYNINKYIDVMGSRLSTVHICDVSKFGNPCLPGKGKIDFDKLMQSLLKAQYTGDLLIEVYNNTYADVKELKSAYDHIYALTFKYRNEIREVERAKGIGLDEVVVE